MEEQCWGWHSGFMHLMIKDQRVRSLPTIRCRWLHDERQWKNKQPNKIIHADYVAAASIVYMHVFRLFVFLFLSLSVIVILSFDSFMSVRKSSAKNHKNN